MEAAKKGKSQTPGGEPAGAGLPVFRRVRSACNLLAFVSLGLIFGGALGLLFQLLSGQR